MIVPWHAVAVAEHIRYPDVGQSTPAGNYDPDVTHRGSKKCALTGGEGGQMGGAGVLLALSDESGMSLGWYCGNGSLWKWQWPTAMAENEDSSSDSSWCALS